MSLAILVEKGDGHEFACFYDSASMWAFSMVFPGGAAEAQAFLRWLQQRPGEPIIGNGTDPREYNQAGLETRYTLFKNEMQPCDGCGAWVRVVDGCEACRPLPCCGHEKSVHDDVGCYICQCQKGVE